MNPFYRWPKWKQHLWTTVTSIAGFGLYILWILMMTNTYGLWAIFMVFFIVPLVQFLTTPMNRKTGVFKYYSPMLLVYNANEKTYDLHNGTSFDYLFVMKWSDRGIKAKRKLLAYYMEGFLKIIEEIESGEIPGSVKIIGTSYFFSESTAKRLGFELAKPTAFYIFNIYLNYLDLLWMYSFSNGKLTFPSVKNIKKVEISVADFVKNKAYYQKLYNRLSKEYKLLQMHVV